MNKLKVMRAKKNITQDELAKLCNLSRATINSIEKNRSAPRCSTKNKIATALNCNIKYLFEGEGENDGK